MLFVPQFRSAPRRREAAARAPRRPPPPRRPRWPASPCWTRTRRCSTFPDQSRTSTFSSGAWRPRKVIRRRLPWVRRPVGAHEHGVSVEATMVACVGYMLAISLGNRACQPNRRPIARPTYATASIISQTMVLQPFVSRLCSEDAA